MISDLQTDFDLTDEGDIESFLSIKFKQNNNKITMSQPELINYIINNVNMIKMQTG